MWKLTPAEFIELYEGWQWRENRRVEEIKSMHELRMREYSVLGSWLLSAQVKKTVKPTDLYNPERINKLNTEKKTTTPEESKKILDKLEKQLGVK
ncbi:hypothetical protein QFZ28_004363 [Neobacillus niacini]|uniref:hypothetical protein n=1 Tax=Neobacillus niacini TaxID=86668 RepID=UPI0027803606|nr:hypothetical protein [Neobacillus niacini]MDQ1003963.1 hypothetical protein [Neobacillus niacini]